MEFIELTDEQEVSAASALNHIVLSDLAKRTGYMHPNNPNGYVIAGYAGTGKSVVIEFIYNTLSRMGIIGTVISFTGRAASNLSSRGIPAKTAHSVLKEPVLDSNGNLLHFRDKTVDDILATVGSFLIIEEASMMPEDINEIILQLSIPLLYVGDDAQLQPVNSTSIFDSMANGNHVEWPVNFVEKIRRQGEGSDIIELATNIRLYNRIAISNRNSDEVHLVRKDASFMRKFLPQNWSRYEIILCPTNKTRKMINAKIRALKGYHSDTPLVGERLICTRNDYKENRFLANGELFEVTSKFGTQKGIHKYTLKSVDTDGKMVTVEIDDEMFISEQRTKKNEGNKELSDFTYGYCISTHKSQGSTFESVLYIDEDVSYFMDQQSLRYTAVTRAAKHVTVAY